MQLLEHINHVKIVGYLDFRIEDDSSYQIEIV